MLSRIVVAEGLAINFYCCKGWILYDLEILMNIEFGYIMTSLCIYNAQLVLPGQTLRNRRGPPLCMLLKSPFLRPLWREFSLYHFYHRWLSSALIEIHQDPKTTRGWRRSHGQKKSRFPGKRTNRSLLEPQSDLSQKHNLSTLVEACKYIATQSSTQTSSSNSAF